MNNKQYKTKEEMQQDIVAQLAQIASQPTRRAVPTPFNGADPYRAKLRQEVDRVFDEFCDVIRATFTPFGIIVPTVNIRYGLPPNVREMYLKLVAARLKVDAEAIVRTAKQEKTADSL